MMRIRIIALCLLSCSGLFVECKRQVYEVRPKDERELRLVKDLVHLYDVWRGGRSVGENTHVYVDEHKELHFEEWLMKESIGHSVVVEDVDALLTQLEGDVEQTAKSGNENDVQEVQVKPTFRLDRYHQLEEINKWMETIAKDNPKIVKRFVMAKSYNNRPIYGLRIMGGSSDEDRPVMWMDGGMHAREWVSPATVIYIASKLIEEYGDDKLVTKLLNTMTFYMVPVVNVDGYSYTWTNTTDSDYRLWRKTRSYFPGNECVGTDPNRNFDHHFGGEGTSNDSCANTYHGPAPFSEPESLGLAKYLQSIENLYMYFTFHSYSQVYLIPYGYDHLVAPNYNASMDICEDAVSALHDVHGEVYRCGSIAEIMYLCAGTSVDYALAEGGAKFSFGPELRDTGDYGFLLPSNQILPTGEENYAAIKVFAASYFDQPDN